MQAHFQIRIGSLSGSYQLYCLLNPFRIPPSCLPRTLTSSIAMATESGSSKRPMCPKCSKPAQICLCTRLKTPSLENSVAVTILQHSLEKKHPLNSTRIASLGIRNLTVVSVSDVNFQARFIVGFHHPGHESGSGHLDEKSSDFGVMENGKRKWDSVKETNLCTELEESSDFGKFLESLEEKRSIFADSNEEFSRRTEFGSVKESEFCVDGFDISQKKSGLLLNNNGCNSDLDTKLRGEDVLHGSLEKGMSNCKSEAFIISNISRPVFGPIGAVSGLSGDNVVDFTIEKYGLISSFCSQLQKQDNFDKLLDSKVAANDLGRGFTIKKRGRKQVDGIVGYEEFEEFEINVPSGSVLLFPSEKSVGIECIDFEVKNLIVLDGTWAKAKRMYSENPWLKLLPHLKLDLDKLSLYSEVRHQPKAGCLSTIESIVYALKAFGEDSEKLDGLLEVFKSMVGDQRRCKDERLSKVSVKPSQS